MTTHSYLPEEAMIRKAIEALMQALGPVETARFLNLAHNQQMDAVAMHQRWQAELDAEEFLEQVFVEVDQQ